MRIRNSFNCGLCGRAMLKAKRVVEGVAYCSKCVVKKPCPTCGEGSMVPRTLKSLPCRKCSIAGRACDRCGNPLPLASRIVGDKAYCYPCTRHLDEPKPCELCGTPSRFLSRDYKHGISAKACPKCRNSVSGNVTCSRCGKFRPFGGVDSDGKKLCSKCYPDLLAGVPAPKCSICGKEAPFRVKDYCQVCSHRVRIRQTLIDHAATLVHEWARELAVRFAEDIYRTYSRNSPNRVKKYQDFFTTIDATYDSPGQITPESLARNLGYVWRREYPLICGCLITEGILPPYDGHDYNEACFYHAQLAILKAAEGRWYHGLLVEYHQEMQQYLQLHRERGWKGKHIRYTQKTVRMAMQAATAFLGSAECKAVTQRTELTSTMFDRFLLARPGSRHSLSNFVRFLNENRKTFKRLRKIKSFKAEVGKEISLGKYFNLLTEWTQPQPGKAGKALACLFGLLFAQRANRIVRMTLSDVKMSESGGFEVKFKDVWLPMPDEVSSVIAQFLKEREAWSGIRQRDNLYLFPGRHVVGSHLDASSVTSWFKDFGVKGFEMYRTALLKFFRNNIQSPKVAEVTLGINAQTAAKYHAAVDVRQRNEVRRWNPHAK
jgi:hypothetical protein